MPYFSRTVLVTVLVHPLLGWALDLQPNDIVAPLPDRTIAMVSFFNTENTNFYKNGSVSTIGPYANPVIDNVNYIARLSRSYTFGDLPGLSFIQAPYATTTPSGSLASNPSSNGIGDTILTTAIWPYANHDTRTYFAVAAYLILPTGSYNSSQAFNAGNNRYSSDLQIGFQKRITQNLEGMIAIDSQWFGGNSQCAAACGSITNTSLTQKPVITTQLGPIYKINQTFTVGASYFYVTGGATEINNVYQNNVMNTQRFLLSALAYTDIGRFSLQYGRDIDVQNGFMQNRLLAIRYLKAF